MVAVNGLSTFEMAIYARASQTHSSKLGDHVRNKITPLVL